MAKTAVHHFQPSSCELQFHAAKATAVGLEQKIQDLDPNLSAQEEYSPSASSPPLVWLAI